MRCGRHSSLIRDGRLNSDLKSRQVELMLFKNKAVRGESYSELGVVGDVVTEHDKTPVCVVDVELQVIRDLKVLQQKEPML